VERVISERSAEISKKQGEETLKLTTSLLMSQSESMIKSLPAIVQSNQIDALIINYLNYYVELAAIQLDIPYIHVYAGMHFDFSGHTPLMFYGWPHEITAAALARNQDGVAKFIQMRHEAGGGIRALADAAGLKIDWDNLHSTLSPWASISQVPKAFDFESSHWPAQFHHTGPFHDGKGREPVDFPWDRITGEPLIYASMGTILNGRADVFRTIIAALAKHKDLTTCAFDWGSDRSSAAWTRSQECHHCEAGASIRFAEACLSLHHPRRTKHGTGISSPGSSAGGHPGGL
jgi:zeaxanthin glucosyltransferase